MATNQMYGTTAVSSRITTATKTEWTGRIISGFMILFLLFDSVSKLFKASQAIEGSVDLGYPSSTVVWIGLTLLICTVLYAIPRTAILGAILLTGYLGGATATQVRVESSDFVYAIVFGALVWAGLYLRNERVRSLLEV